MKHPVDVNVGKRIRQRRWDMGVTQQQLASKVGIKFQQIQKYESGANRVSASRLYEISQALEAPISYFFEGAGTAGSGEDASDGEDPTGSREASDLIRAYHTMSAQQRKHLADLTRVLGPDGPNIAAHPMEAATLNVVSH